VPRPRLGRVREFVVYTLMRVVLFAATFAVLAGIWALAFNSFPWFALLVVAFVVSGIASYFLLNGQRVAFASRVEKRADAAMERMRSREDMD
jgi:drug/metabolite transporter (DMT)-like permease